MKTLSPGEKKRIENAAAEEKKRIANGPPLPHRHQIQTAPTKKNVLKTGRRKKKKRIENGDRREKKNVLKTVFVKTTFAQRFLFHGRLKTY